MMFVLLYAMFACVLGVVTIQGQEMHYAVIVAGSRGFVNYRHQADACHAYHVLLNGGMPAGNIIVMSYDDAANAKENPFPGKLYNKPTTALKRQAVDVYKGCKIDYRGKDVTKETFTAVLTGDADAVANITGNANNRVLTSTKNDNVFINFVDHGGVGIIAMPVGNTMTAKQLQSALNTMHRKKMYKRLIFYMEACESGSMFEKTLPKDMNIYALTAANAKESSWGTYCPPHGDMIKGKHMGTCLGDLFSVNWMQESDSEHSNGFFNLTLRKQHRYVKRTTNKSHVMVYGDKSFMGEDVDSFEGDEHDIRQAEGSTLPLESDLRLKLISAVDSRDIRLHYLYQRYLNANSEDKPTALQEMNEELNLRDFYDKSFAKFQQALNLLPVGSDLKLSDDGWDTYGNVINFFETTCKKPDLHDYVMKYYGLLYQACQLQTEIEIKQLIEKICNEN